jgi:hypothetical protein
VSHRPVLADLLASLVPVVLLAAAPMGCGGGSALTPKDSGAADGLSQDGAPSDGASHGGDTQDGAPGATGLVAANGTRIPDPPLKDPCTALGIASKSCGPDDVCPALTCDCGGVQQKIEVAGSCKSSRVCLTGVSCPDVCTAPNFATDTLFVCLYAGVCSTDADCTDPKKPTCLRSLDGSRGHCVFGQKGSDCYRDADCATGACVAMMGGPRWCQDKQVGSSCNRDEQCDSPTNGIGKSACVLRPGEFQGVCSDGSEPAPCLSTTDCLPGYACAKLVAGEFGQCTSRGKGAVCAVDADCAQGLCVSPSGTWGQCGTGEVGALCADGNDCHSGFCFSAKCSAGTTGSPCVLDTECATHMCASAGPGALMPGQCTDGKLGSPCWGAFSTQCGAGLHCTGGTPGSETCTAP